MPQDGLSVVRRPQGGLSVVHSSPLTGSCNSGSTTAQLTGFGTFTGTWVFVANRKI